MENFNDLEHYMENQEERPPEIVAPAVTEQREVAAQGNKETAPVQPVPTLPPQSETNFNIDFSPEDVQKLKDFTHAAYRLKLIPKETMADYIKFCLDAGSQFIINRVNGR